MRKLGGAEGIAKRAGHVLCSSTPSLQNNFKRRATFCVDAMYCIYAIR